MALAVAMAAAVTASQPSSLVTYPSWLRRPSAIDVASFWPAQGRGMTGSVVMSCVVTARGLLDKCEITSETPPDHGFGHAALLLARMFEMRPMTVNGAPVGGGHVEIPIRFVAAAGGGGIGLPAVRVVDNLAWRATPTAAQLAAAFPREALGKVASAHVVLRCQVTSHGALGECETSSEAPAGDGFAQAARGLTKDFAAPAELPGVNYGKRFYVNLPFDFRDPSRPSPPVEVIDPLWLQTPDPAMAGKLFPPEAAKAGFSTGVAVVDCEVTHEGRLGGCTVARETPPNLGFGAAALALANVLIMNAWTNQGDPVDGARVKMPIRINLTADAKAAAPR